MCQELEKKKPHPKMGRADNRTQVFARGVHSTRIIKCAKPKWK